MSPSAVPCSRSLCPLLRAVSIPLQSPGQDRAAPQMLLTASSLKDLGSPGTFSLNLSGPPRAAPSHKPPPAQLDSSDSASVEFMEHFGNFRDERHH